LPLTLNVIDRADTVGRVLEIRGFARRQFHPKFDALNQGSWALFAVSLSLLVMAVASPALGQDLFVLPVGR